MHSDLSLTLCDILETNASRFRDFPAYIVGERRLTHGELLNRARRLASALHNFGVRKQNRVAVLSMNSIEICETLAAGHCSGIIIVPVNFRLAPQEMKYIINDSSPRVLIFEAQYLPAIEKIRGELTSVQTFVCIGQSVEWAKEYESFVASGSPDTVPVKPCEDDYCYVIYTSGTTGKPKGCIWDQRGIRAMAQHMATELRVGPTDRALVVMPMFHIGGMSIALGLHFRGGAVHLHPLFEPPQVLSAIVRERISVLLFAPTMLQMLLDEADAERTDFSSVRTVVYSAAPMPSPLLKRAIKLMGKVFINLYGQTEVSTSGLDRNLHLPDGTERERGWLVSVGHPFSTNALVRIVDENGDNCPPNTPGEIVVKSTLMFRGYWNNHAATLETIRDGWCHSGDIGRLDQDGILYLMDRKKDMIISGGENIYSREVEEAVIQHPAVDECAVIGLSDPKWGEAVCAVVKLKQGKTATEEEIVEHVKTLIASYKKPKSVVFVAELPKLATGKINKVELRSNCSKPD